MSDGSLISAVDLAGAALRGGFRHVVLDLFAGMGGLGRSMELQGIGDQHGVLHLHFETDQRCRDLLARHHSQAHCFLALDTQTADPPDPKKNPQGSVFSLASQWSCLQSFLQHVDNKWGLLSILVAGGFPCVGNSRANSNPTGSCHPESKKVIIFPVVIGQLASCSFKSHVDIIYMIENVVMDVNDLTRESRDRLSEVLQVEPDRHDASRVSPASRERLIWTNLPSQELPSLQIDARDYLDDHWAPVWELPDEVSKPNLRFSTFLRGFSPGWPGPKEIPEDLGKVSRLPLHAYSDRQLVYLRSASPAQKATIKHWLKRSIQIKTDGLRTRGSAANRARCELMRFIHLEGGHETLRPLNGPERDRVLGFKPGSSSLPSDSSSEEPISNRFFIRGHMEATGNTFSCQMISRVLSPWCSWVLQQGQGSSAISLKTSFLPKVTDLSEAERLLVPPQPSGGHRS